MTNGDNRRIRGNAIIKGILRVGYAVFTGYLIYRMPDISKSLANTYVDDGGTKGISMLESILKVGGWVGIFYSARALYNPYNTLLSMILPTDRLRHNRERTENH